MKASDWMKLAHRIQVALYAAILRSSSKSRDRSRIGQGGVWLYEQPEAEWFDLVHILPPLETFLEEDLGRVLSTPADETFWHLYFKCEWCDYYSHCRKEAEDAQSISLLPYLSTFGKRHLEGQGIRSLSEFSKALDADAEGGMLEGSASLEGRRTQLTQSLDALETGTSRLTGASSIAMPIGEQVRIVMTLQSEPLSGAVYGYAINRVFGRDLFDSPTGTIARVAPAGDPNSLIGFRRQLVRDLLAILRPVHDHNRENSEEWRAQKSVQAYVFDTYERDLLTSELLEAVLDPVVAEDALSLLFHFQRPELAAAEDHPADEVFFPVVVLNHVIENVMALPIPVVNRFPDVVAQLAPSQYAFAYQDNEFSPSLSNRLKSNAILEIWQKDRTDMIPSVEWSSGRGCGEPTRSSTASGSGSRERGLCSRGLRSSSSPSRSGSVTRPCRGSPSSRVTSRYCSTSTSAPDERRPSRNGWRMSTRSGSRARARTDTASILPRRKPRSHSERSPTTSSPATHPRAPGPALPSRTSVSGWRIGHRRTSRSHSHPFRHAHG